MKIITGSDPLCILFPPIADTLLDKSPKQLPASTSTHFVGDMQGLDKSECLYSILEVPPDATLPEIKKSYQNLILKHHPDKVENYSGSSQFQKIDRAWKVLREPETRKQYDAEAGQQEYNDVPIVNESLRVEELDFDVGEGIYGRPCRCGGSYAIDKSDLDDMDSNFYLNCSECSLVIEILIKGG